MKKANLLLLVSAIFIGGIFLCCSKEVTAPRGVDQNQAVNNDLQSVFFQNITIDSSQPYTFVIPEITQSVIQGGSVKAYAVYAVEQGMQWRQLPIINSCSSRLEVTALSVGRIVIQNNLGAAATMTYRFDILPGSAGAE